MPRNDYVVWEDKAARIFLCPAEAGGLPKRVQRSLSSQHTTKNHFYLQEECTL